METTKKRPSETAAEIQNFLKDYDLSKFMLDYRDGDICGVIFAISINGTETPYKLPINHLPLFQMARNGETKYIRDEDQARRVAWRQVLKWIQAQMALVETGMVELQEIFLPYMIIDHKKQLTVWDKFSTDKMIGMGDQS
jgi:hypothetical protein